MSTPSNVTACPTFYAAQHGERMPGRTPAPPVGSALALCQRDVMTTEEGTQVAEAARRMRDEQVGALVVVKEVAPNHRRVTGIVTDHDVATRVVAQDCDPRTFRVGDIMTRELVTARPDDTAIHLLNLMHRERVRRVPVIGPEAELIGIVSLDDLVTAVSWQVQALADAVRGSTRPT